MSAVFIQSIKKIAVKGYVSVGLFNFPSPSDSFPAEVYKVKNEKENQITFFEMLKKEIVLLENTI